MIYFFSLKPGRDNRGLGAPGAADETSLDRINYFTTHTYVGEFSYLY